MGEGVGVSLIGRTSVPSPGDFRREERSVCTP